MLYFVFAGLITALDRLVKLWTERTLGEGQVIELLPGVLRLTYAENTGAAFGALAGMRWLLIAVSAAAAAALVFIILTNKSGGSRLFAASVLGGTVGNLIDRIATGRVIDTFEPEFVNFAIFNVADIFITLGGIAFVLCALRSALPSGGRGGRRPPPAAETPAAESPEENGGELTEERILEEYYRDLRKEAEADSESGDGR
ncbi:MAG: signal peptidase II [Oscillospiraceae bacterium]|jgi:signal peptidase II|nr:signal peptidase II [Oscillospiraceae bacterium]